MSNSRSSSSATVKKTSLRRSHSVTSFTRSKSNNIIPSSSSSTNSPYPKIKSNDKRRHSSIVSTSALNIAPLFPPEKDYTLEKDSIPTVQNGNLQIFFQLVEPTIYLQGFESDEITKMNPPSILRGSMIVRILKPTKLKKIDLTFRGLQRTEWPEGIPPKKIETYEANDIVTHTWNFFHHNPKTGKKQKNYIFKPLPAYVLNDSSNFNNTTSPNHSRKNSITSLTSNFSNANLSTKSPSSNIFRRSKAFSSENLLSPTKSLNNANLSESKSLKRLSFQPSGNGSIFKNVFASSSKEQLPTSSSMNDFSSLNNINSNSNNNASSSNANANSNDYTTFNPGDYIFSFEKIIPPTFPESITADYGYVKYYLRYEIQRYGTFKTNINGNYPITIIRTPSENSVEDTEPIEIIRDWESQLHYDIVIASKDIILDAFLPITFNFYPVDKVTLHRVKIYLTETMEYYCHDHKVRRLEPTKKFLLAEIDGPIDKSMKHQKNIKAKDLGNLLTDDLSGDLINKSYNLDIFVPSSFNSNSNLAPINKKQFLHPDTFCNNIKANHWIKICLRLSKEVDGKRKHYEINIDSPIHVLHKLCSHANILLPSYNFDVNATTNNNSHKFKTRNKRHSSYTSHDNIHKSNFFFPKEILMSNTLSSSSPENKRSSVDLSQPIRARTSQYFEHHYFSTPNKRSHSENTVGDQVIFSSPKFKSNVYQPETLQRELLSPQAMPLSPHETIDKIPILNDLGNTTEVPPPPFDFKFELPKTPPNYGDIFTKPLENPFLACKLKRSASNSMKKPITTPKKSIPLSSSMSALDVASGNTTSTKSKSKLAMRSNSDQSKTSPISDIGSTDEQKFVTPKSSIKRPSRSKSTRSLTSPTKPINDLPKKPIEPSIIEKAVQPLPKKLEVKQQDKKSKVSSNKDLNTSNKDLNTSTKKSTSPIPEDKTIKKVTAIKRSEFPKLLKSNSMSNNMLGVKSMSNNALKFSESPTKKVKSLRVDTNPITPARPLKKVASSSSSKKSSKPKSKQANCEKSIRKEKSPKKLASKRISLDPKSKTKKPNNNSTASFATATEGESEASTINDHTTSSSNSNSNSMLNEENNHSLSMITPPSSDIGDEPEPDSASIIRIENEGDITNSFNYSDSLAGRLNMNMKLNKSDPSLAKPGQRKQATPQIPSRPSKKTYNSNGAIMNKRNSWHAASLRNNLHLNESKQVKTSKMPNREKRHSKLISEMGPVINNYSSNSTVQNMSSSNSSMTSLITAFTHISSSNILESEMGSPETSPTPGLHSSRSKTILPDIAGSNHDPSDESCYNLSDMDPEGMSDYFSLFEAEPNNLDSPVESETNNIDSIFLTQSTDVYYDTTINQVETANIINTPVKPMSINTNLPNTMSNIPVLSPLVLSPNIQSPIPLNSTPRSTKNMISPTTKSKDMAINRSMLQSISPINQTTPKEQIGKFMSTSRQYRNSLILDQSSPTRSNSYPKTMYPNPEVTPNHTLSSTMSEIGMLNRQTRSPSNPFRQPPAALQQYVASFDESAVDLTAFYSPEASTDHLDDRASTNPRDSGFFSIDYSYDNNNIALSDLEAILQTDPFVG